MARAGIPHAYCAAHMAGDVLIKHGSQALRDQFLARIARGEIEFAVGYSEPGAGSDMLALRMKAEDFGDHYLVNGQKVFNTHAHQAEYHWLAARTDPAAPNHKALSILLVDLDSPGISIRPMYTIAGSRTNEVFYDNVRVPKERLVGELNRGFTYILGQLARERCSRRATCPHFESIVRAWRHPGCRRVPPARRPVTDRGTPGFPPAVRALRDPDGRGAGAGPGVLGAEALHVRLRTENLPART